MLGTQVCMCVDVCLSHMRNVMLDCNKPAYRDAGKKTQKVGEAEPYCAAVFSALSAAVHTCVHVRVNIDGGWWMNVGC